MENNSAIIKDRINNLQKLAEDLKAQYKKTEENFIDNYNKLLEMIKKFEKTLENNQ